MVYDLVNVPALKELNDYYKWTFIYEFKLNNRTNDFFSKFFDVILKVLLRNKTIKFLFIKDLFKRT